MKRGCFMRKKAFTMAELVISLTIIAILAIVLVPIARNKLGKVDSLSYYLGYSVVQDIAANIVAQSEYAYVLSGNNASDILPEEPSEDTSGAAQAVPSCNANQYKDLRDNCQDCANISSWQEYQNYMPPCPQDCARFGMLYSSAKRTCVMPASATSLCLRIKDEYNISKSSCDVSASQMAANVAGGFKDKTPHIKLSNGLNLYIVSDLLKVDMLADSEGVEDRVGYLVYVDVNGDEGKGALYSDVFPFYILVSGKVVPLYSSPEAGGANSVENLSGNILYDDYSTGNRVVKVSKTNLDFKTGACATGYIKSAIYCGSIESDAHCANSDSDCRYIINKPMKFFGK